MPVLFMHTHRTSPATPVTCLQPARHGVIQPASARTIVPTVAGPVRRGQRLPQSPACSVKCSWLRIKYLIYIHLQGKHVTVSTHTMQWKLMNLHGCSRSHDCTPGNTTRPHGTATLCKATFRDSNPNMQAGTDKPVTRM